MTPFLPVSIHIKLKDVNLNTSTTPLENCAVFPLPQMVLLPHTTIPLHIFEPRYLNMIQDCLSMGTPLVLTYNDEKSYKGRVCGYGMPFIMGKRADGSLEIIVNTVGVLRLVEESSLTPYLKFSFSKYKTDDGLMDEATSFRYVALEQKFKKWISQNIRGPKDLKHLKKVLNTSQASLSYAALFLLEDYRHKQTFLEQTSLKERVDFLYEQLNQDLITLNLGSA